MVFQIGVTPCRIDILTGIDGVDFDGAWPNRVEVEIIGLRVMAIGRADLIKNKRITARPQDIADLARLDKFEDTMRLKLAAELIHTGFNRLVKPLGGRQVFDAPRG